MNNGTFHIEQNIPWQDLGNGIQRQIFGYDEQIMLVKAKFETNAIAEMHQHPHVQVSYVESGVFEITIDGKTKLLYPGDGFYVAPHLIHGGKCIQAGILVDVFTPHREDFITTAP